MTTFWIIYIVLELTAAVLFTVGRLKKNDKILKPGLIFCAAAMIAFFICIKEPFSGDPWALTGMPLIAGMIPVVLIWWLAEGVSAVVRAVRQKSTDGLPLGLKILCVIMLIFGAEGVFAIAKGASEGNGNMIVGGVFLALLFLSPGIFFLTRWKKK